MNLFGCKMEERKKQLEAATIPLPREVLMFDMQVLEMYPFAWHFLLLDKWAVVGYLMLVFLLVHATIVCNNSLEDQASAQ